MSITTHTRRDLMADLSVTGHLPEGAHGAATVERYEVTRADQLHAQLRGRGTRPGTYTRLVVDGRLWMSDTDAERRDHLPALFAMSDHGGRVLIGGLGLGCVVRAALLTPGVTHVDVVEIHPDVRRLVGPYYRQLAAALGKTIDLYHGDALTMTWPRGTRWGVVWMDVWAAPSTDDLATMHRLRRSYGQRAAWADCWGRTHLLAQRERGW